MITVKKEDCKFSTRSHSMISSSAGLRTEINMEHKNIKYMYTNIGFIKFSKYRFQCPQSLWPNEAKKEIEGFGEKFSIEG